MTAQSPLPVIQNAWVVPSIAAAAAGWLKLGVGPFLTVPFDLPQAHYRGSVVPLQFTIALAQAGPVQIELIEQHSDGPSAYRDVYAQGQGGFHHVCRALGGYDETLARLHGSGAAVVTEASFGPARFCYVDTRAMLGCMLELADESSAGLMINEQVRQAAIGWDGLNPIRPAIF